MAMISQNISERVLNTDTTQTDRIISRVTSPILPGEPESGKLKLSCLFEALQTNTSFLV